MTSTIPLPRTAGWREWIALPDLGVSAIKAKLDTGARTSAVHAFDVETYEKNGQAWVRFSIHPLQKDDLTAIPCDALLVDRRMVTNPGGRREQRLIVETTLALGGEAWPIELSLTDRDEMGMRMLLGRTAMKKRLVVDPARSYVLGKRKRKQRKSRRTGDDAG